MATATRVKGHALKADGAAFNEMGERLYPKTTSGTGSARCECRELSPEYGTRKERVDWHKAHKLRHAEPGSVTREDPEALFDEAPLDEAPAEPETTPAATGSVDFPHAKKWWKALGKEGAQLLLSDFPVTVDFDDKERVIHLSGDPAVIDSAGDFLEYAWDLALQGFREWKRSDAVYEARGLVTKDSYKQSRDRLRAQEGFLTSFCLDHEELQRVFFEK